MDIAQLSRSYNEYNTLVKEINISDFAPQDFLNDFESPFKWVQTLKNENLALSDYLLKLDDYNGKRETDGFKKFVPLLSLAFEFSLLRNFHGAKYILGKIEDMLCSMRRNGDSVYDRIGLALEHIFLATKTSILIFENDLPREINLLKEKCKTLKCISEMEPLEQAGILAVKAKFYLECTTKRDLALEHMKEAAKLDPEFATWKFWIGKMLRKIRKYAKERDPSEEMCYFEEAVGLDRDPIHIVFLAQAYREKASYMIRMKRFISDDEEEIIDSMNEKSKTLYMESVDLKSSSAAICRKAGNGLMKLPKPFANYPLAKQLLHKAEELPGNPVIYHVIGTYYKDIEEDQDKAVEYFQKSADNRMVYGLHELIRIKQIKDPDYDALEDLLRAEKSFSKNTFYIKADLGWYYLTVKDDIHKALEYFWEVMNNEKKVGFLKKFSCFSFLVKGPLNIYTVMQEKIMDIGEEERNELMVTFLDKVRRNADLLDDSDCISFEKAQREALSQLRWERRKNQNQNRHDRSNNWYAERNRLPNVRYQNQKHSMSKFSEEPTNRNRTTEMTNRATASTSNQNDNRSEEPTNRNRKTETTNRTWASTSKKNNNRQYNVKCAEKMHPEQGNWRLECRKFQN